MCKQLYYKSTPEQTEHLILTSSSYYEELLALLPFSYVTDWATEKLSVTPRSQSWRWGTEILDQAVFLSLCSCFYASQLPVYAISQKPRGGRMVVKALTPGTISLPGRISQASYGLLSGPVQKVTEPWTATDIPTVDIIILALAKTTERWLYANGCGWSGPGQIVKTLGLVCIESSVETVQDSSHL